jgi:4,5-dihydroxyphthalate decarboxylase
MRMYEGKPTLKVLLGEYPKTQAIRGGDLKMESAALDIADITVAQKGFKAMVRDLAFDIAEVAIATYLIAHEYGKPYVLLPFVMNGRFHHGSLFYNAGRGVLRPQDLNGKRIGMRAYTQTTPTWVRGFLADDFGFDPRSVNWVTFEDAHVAEYVEPPNVARAPEGAKLAKMLQDGEIDAAMMGSGVEGDDRIRPIIADAKTAARAWYDKHHAVPINHMIAVRRELAEARPDIVAGFFALLLESRARVGGPKVEDGIDLQPVGMANVRASVAKAVDYAINQQLLRRPTVVEDLFTPSTARLHA